MTRSRMFAKSMAQTTLFITFLGSGLSFMLWINGNRDAAGQVCLGFGGVAVVVLLIGSYLVARARTSEVE